MKINKHVLLEKTTRKLNEATDENNLVADADQSTSELAQDIQDASEVISDGKQVISDKEAEVLAKKAKNAADDLDAEKVVIANPFAENVGSGDYVFVENAVTAELDHAFAENMEHRRFSDAISREYYNVLIIGPGGGGKTGIVHAWARERNINLVEVKANDPDLYVLINGYRVRGEDETVTNPDTGETYTKPQVRQAVSKFLSQFEAENTVMFLDEYNRAPGDLRATLLKLINEHTASNEYERNNIKKFNNLIFTIGAINPPSISDKNAHMLNQPELGRFSSTVYYSANGIDTFNYLSKAVKQRLGYLWDLTPEEASKTSVYHKGDKNAWYKDLIDYARVYWLGKQLTLDPSFEYSPGEEEYELTTHSVTAACSRALVKGLLLSRGYVDKFLEWLSNASNFAGMTLSAEKKTTNNLQMAVKNIVELYSSILENLPVPSDQQLLDELISNYTTVKDKNGIYNVVPKSSVNKPQTDDPNANPKETDDNVDPYNIGNDMKNGTYNPDKDEEALFQSEKDNADIEKTLDDMTNVISNF